MLCTKHVNLKFSKWFCGGSMKEGNVGDLIQIGILNIMGGGPGG